MKHINHNIRKPRAIAKVIRIEIYIAIALMLLLSLAALPAKAAMEEGATFFEYANEKGMNFNVGGVYSESDAPAGQTEHMASITSKDVMLKAHYETALSSRATFEVKGGLGVSATEHQTYTANDRTDITPAFKVGMGVSYKF